MFCLVQTLDIMFLQFNIFLEWKEMFRFPARYKIVREEKKERLSERIEVKHIEKQR